MPPSTAVIVIIAGSFLPFIGAQLAEAMGWHKTFVGTQLVAGITSLPELAITVAALRMSALDMAIANLLGSNLFNISILAFDDLTFLKCPLLLHVAPMHAVSAVFMNGIVISGLAFRANTRLFRTAGWTA